MYFEEYEACISARLDIERWEAGDYPIWLKANVIARYRLHGLIENHAQDAQNKKMKADSKRKKR